MNTIRILLADDHSLVRSGFKALLDGIDGIEVVAEAEDGHQVLQILSENQLDLVLMDVAMPGLNGLDTTARLVLDHPNTKVIILSMHAMEEYVLQALKVGAHGYLLKDSDISELTFAVESVMRGDTYLSPAISEHVVMGYLSGSDKIDKEKIISPGARLTPRQREILQMIAEGNTSKEIAQILKISHKTVNVHRLRIMNLLNVHDIPGLVRYALRIGLISE